jgi:hypothetical protein
MSETFKKIAEEYAKLRITNILVQGKKSKKFNEDIAAEIIQVLETDCHFVIEEK